MAAGRIMNRALLQLASRFLGIEGVKQFPAVLDLQDIKVVYALQAPASPPELFSRVSRGGPGAGVGLPIAGSGFAGYDILSGDPADEPFMLNTDFDCWIVGFSLDLEYDAAGATADNGQVLSLAINRRSAVGDVITPIIDMSNWGQVATSVLNYRFNLGMYTRATGTPMAQNPVTLMQENYVPRGEGVNFLMGRTTGAFPANTTIGFTLHVLAREAPLSSNTVWAPPS